MFWKAHERKRPEGFFSNSFKDLIQQMIAFDPNERLTILGIASHPWVKGQICTHGEIIHEFSERQVILDKILEAKRKEQDE